MNSSRKSASRIAQVRLPFPIIYEDADILVIDKPTGLLTSTTPREKRQTALALVRRYVEASDSHSRAGLIHRLDRDASGLLVFSRNQRAFAALKRQFFRHDVDRVYLALVQGVPNPRSGRIESWLVERADGTVRSTRRGAAGQRAISDYETLQTDHRQSLLRVRLLTGRKHQIRVHLSDRGCPIVNDPLYGPKKPDGRMMLAAVELALDHPRTGKRCTFSIPPPREMRQANA
ncbi:MAG: RluA family pseudouridine synthase [Tepidisphaeraceae bacterium]